MPMGVDFRKHLDQQVAECHVLLAIIGRQWAENPRLQEESDFVRIEIEYGLDPEREIIVVPVLVGNAPMPSVNQLPPCLKNFAYRNAIKVRPDPDFHKDMDKLTRGLEGLLDVPLTDEQPAVIKAAGEGDAEAQFKKGLMYAKGEGVEQDHEEAVKCYRKAAEGGNIKAQYNLGGAYHFGEGVEQDHEEAVKWICKAAEQGHAGAQGVLGWAYNKGEGVEQDYKEAAKWYRKAAQQGDAWAQYELGRLYANGQGVLEDQVSAYAWHNIAATNGKAEAKEAKEKAEKEMSPDQKAEGQKLAREMLEKNPNLLKD